MEGAEITIDGQSQPISSVALRHLNFSQPWRTPRVAHLAYTLKIPHACLIEVPESELDPFVADAKKFPDHDDPLSVRLRQNNWPEITDLLNDSDLRELALRTFQTGVPQRALDRSPNSKSYILNTSTHTAVDPTSLRFEGLCAHASQLTAYQDI
jgi:hypothetical protein